MSSRTAVARVLKESVFDPKKPGALATICNGQPQSYLIARAQEVLRDAMNEVHDSLARGNKIRDAISILAAARLG